MDIFSAHGEALRMTERRYSQEPQEAISWGYYHREDGPCRSGPSLHKDGMDVHASKRRASPEQARGPKDRL